MILGKHTLAETRDLLAVADYRFKVTLQAFVDMQFSAMDDNIRKGIADDVKPLLEKWKQARSDIAISLRLRAAAFPVLSANYIPTEDQWIQTLSYVQGQENVKGSLQDITRRIEAATGKKILYPNQPKQNSSDVDLDLFKELDAAIKAGEQGAAQAAQAGGKAVTSSTGLLIGAAIVGTVVAVGAVKHYL